MSNSFEKGGNRRPSGSEKRGDNQSNKFQADLVAQLPHLRRAASLMVRNSALPSGEDKDIVQETVKRALESRGSFREGTNLAAWTQTIMQNVFRDQTRRMWNRPDKTLRGDAAEIEIDKRASDLDQSSDTMGIEVKEVAKCVDRLAANQRMALEYVAEGYGSEEAAPIMGITPDTFRTHVMRARRNLKNGENDSDSAKKPRDVRKK